jgi:hypothetical protein
MMGVPGSSKIPRKGLQMLWFMRKSQQSLQPILSQCNIRLANAESR